MSSTVETITSLVASATESAVDSSDPTADASQDECSGNPDNADTFLHLRIASIFIILVCSSLGTLFPVIARRSRLRNVIPKSAFDFAKYFGSGVIIATAFIHLLDPATDALSNPCLTGGWQDYPWALALCMFSIFVIFFVELFAFRWGTAKLAKLGITYDSHGHNTGTGHAAHGPEAAVATETASAQAPERPVSSGELIKASALAQVIGIFILEFGVLLHSVLIGLTLAVDEDFKVLFVVLIFHQTFEGLGLGSRLAFLKLPKKYNYVAYVAAIIYGLSTPIGIAAGLGVRSTYNPDSAKASAVSGIMDALSSGVLVYTGLVELLAHEFLFSSEMREASNGKLIYACVCMLFGAGLMSLLGRWA
ncbi:ZIP zinc/iron transport family [Fomitiporia mediterranea MF3/22]|uniref:ZIP zinc/iron transport family n=1 Tax=Fomitiporia mediterranea (strain MF3/22) TaxID=694068 RepID=UPI00044098EA|nr:ZIP zinc/iron transport family [Fomitiporia mediterranea MF3/22]EJD07290.1 ZIP zinc/iron transport family [Fomitiporia mediterranea MF3/22]